VTKEDCGSCKWGVFSTPPGIKNPDTWALGMCSWPIDQIALPASMDFFISKVYFDSVGCETWEPKK
jgi:hypothetical protein